MTPQERDLITQLLGRLKQAGGQAKDPEAETLIRQATAERYCNRNKNKPKLRTN